MMKLNGHANAEELLERLGDRMSDDALIIAVWLDEVSDIPVHEDLADEDVHELADELAYQLGGWREAINYLDDSYLTLGTDGLVVIPADEYYNAEQDDNGVLLEGDYEGYGYVANNGDAVLLQMY